MEWLAVSDLHGNKDRFRVLFKLLEERSPPALLIAGDLFPRTGSIPDFLTEHLFDPIGDLKSSGIGTKILVIPGNDDPRRYEYVLWEADRDSILDYIPMRSVDVEGIPVAGYPFIHPSPFLLKDWELYDVSRFLDPGSVSPLEGIRTFDVDPSAIKYRTIESDLEELSKMTDPSSTVYLFHSPPYDTVADLADIGGMMIDHAPLDPHIGSIAVKRFIEKHQPPVTIHGHVHESYELTGRFHQKIGRTRTISAAGAENGLVLVTFDPEGIKDPVREVIQPTS